LRFRQDQWGKRELRKKKRADRHDSQGGVHAEQEPQLLGTTENELGLRKWMVDQGNELVTTSDKEGENSEFDKQLVDAEIIITTPYACLHTQ
jgi:hypothetical protein